MNKMKIFFILVLLIATVFGKSNADSSSAIATGHKTWLPFFEPVKYNSEEANLFKFYRTALWYGRQSRYRPFGKVLPMELETWSFQMAASTPAGSQVLFEGGFLSENESGRAACEYGEAKQVSAREQYVYAMLNFRTAGRFAKWGFGVSFFKQTERGFCSEGEDYFTVPSVYLALGDMSLFFLSLEVFQSVIFYPTALGVNFRFGHPLNRLWLGISGEENDWSIGAEFDYVLRKHWQVNVQFRQKPFSNLKMLRLGITRIFGKMKK